MSGRGRKVFGEAGTPFEHEKDPLIKRETPELVRAYYKIRAGRVRKRIFEMVKAMGAVSHAEALGGRKSRKSAKARLRQTDCNAMGKPPLLAAALASCFALRCSDHHRWRHAQAGRRYLSPVGHRRARARPDLP